jgi:hypothetical protein
MSNKVSLWIFLFFLLLISYQTIKKTNDENVIKELIIEKNIYNNKNFFIGKKIDEIVNKTFQTNNEFLDMDFKNLNLTKDLLKEKWTSNVISNLNTKTIEKIQKLVTYISNKYNISMKNAEKIVYTTFEEASKKNLEPILVLALIDNESRFQQHIKSPIGAVGLTQVVPKYHQDKIDELKKTEGIDIFSIKGNIKVGTQILRDYINVSDGNLQKALQMYNGNIRDKNKKYSSKIFSKMKEYEKI